MKVNVCKISCRIAWNLTNINFHWSPLSKPLVNSINHWIHWRSLIVKSDRLLVGFKLVFLPQISLKFKFCPQWPDPCKQWCMRLWDGTRLFLSFSLSLFLSFFLSFFLSLSLSLSLFLSIASFLFLLFTAVRLSYACRRYTSLSLFL